MTERGLPIVDGAPACPFVAFEDDRDARATSPDHRHRCYAEIRPAPRALAHQEAYCLASAFPVCPTFQDWARREAARERTTSGAMPPPSADDQPQRNPPRDWSAPPPWGGRRGTGGPDGAADPTAAAGAAGGAYGGPSPNGIEFEADDDAEAPDFLSNRARPGEGLAGSAAYRLATPQAEPDPDRGQDPESPDRPSARPPLPPDRPLEARARPQPEQPEQPPPFFARRSQEQPARRPEPEPSDEWPDDHDHDDPDERYQDRGARAGFGLAGDRRPKVGDTRRGQPRDAGGPSWERPRRYEAYPTLKTRMGLPAIPRVAAMAIALGLAAVAVFFLGPLLLGVGGPDDDGTGNRPSSSPSSQVQPSTSAAPTPVPAPTPQLYTVAAGDTMSRIANRFGVPLDQLIEANRETIPDPDALQIGDQVLIPAIPPDQLGGSPSPSAAGSIAP
jgi:hypothetical protein